MEGSEDKDGLLRSLNMPPIFCGETPNPFMLPEDGIAWSSCLFFVVKVDPPPDSPGKVFTGSGLFMEGDISSCVLAILLGAIVVLKVKVFDLGTV